MGKRTVAGAGVLSVSILSACATIKAEDVKIYSPAQLGRGDYETVKLLWVDSWRTASWVPSYSSREKGIAALQEKAASLDANGLINVACYGDRGLFGWGSESFTCYGKAIKVR